MTRPVRTFLALAVLAALMGCEGTADTDTAQSPAPKNPANPEGASHRVWLVATGQGGAERAHILVRFNQDVPKINDNRNLPWQHRIDVPDDAFLEFQVTIIDVISGKGTVKCYIYAVPHNPDDPPLDEDGPAKDVDCVLAPLLQPA